MSSRRRWVLPVAVVAIAIVVALAWRPLGLGDAGSSVGSRPPLLRDAQAGKPGTAAAFEQRFGPGASEDELLIWLEASRFAIDQKARVAKLRIRSSPCAEEVTVSWTATGGVIDTSRADVAKAGCR